MLQMIWVFVFVLLLFEIEANCTNGLCANNTCSYGYYNTTIPSDPCRICPKLREQYQSENCCTIASTPILYSYETINGVKLKLYSPPRAICKHLWEEWGKCPPICHSIEAGEYCSHNIDCKNTNLCLNSHCCIVDDYNCRGCQNGTGYCNECAVGMAFNVSGDLRCGYCPSWTFTANNICNLYSNCSHGEFVSTLPTTISDRLCQSVSTGYFTNTTNALTPTPWSNCSNGTYSSFGGNSTHDVICTNHTVCQSEESYTFKGNETHDAQCVNSSLCGNVTCI